MKLRKSPSVLVIVLCETRAWEITADEFFENVIRPLNADLALCVGDSDRETNNPFYESAKYIWRFPEPTDWGDAYEEATGNRDWEALLSVHEQFFGGIEHSGSGAIIMFFRYLLGLHLTEEGLLHAYDWMIVLRSDFRWPTPHPPVDCFNQENLYALDGEQWGGISDRYIAVPRSLIQTYLTIVEPIFSEPRELAEKLRSSMLNDDNDYKYFNPEQFLAFRMKELGLWNKVEWLPYMPFAVRLPEGHTRWSEGEFHEDLGYFVKYTGEFQRSKIVSAYIHSQNDWRKYFKRFRGFPLRRRMARENAQILSGR